MAVPDELSETNISGPNGSTGLVKDSKRTIALGREMTTTTGGRVDLTKASLRTSTAAVATTTQLPATDYHRVSPLTISTLSPVSFDDYGNYHTSKVAEAVAERHVRRASFSRPADSQQSVFESLVLLANIFIVSTIVVVALFNCARLLRRKHELTTPVSSQQCPIQPSRFCQNDNPTTTTTESSTDLPLGEMSDLSTTIKSSVMLENLAAMAPMNGRLQSLITSAVVDDSDNDDTVDGPASGLRAPTPMSGLQEDSITLFSIGELSSSEQEATYPIEAEQVGDGDGVDVARSLLDVASVQPNVARTTLGAGSKPGSPGAGATATSSSMDQTAEDGGSNITFQDFEDEEPMTRKYFVYIVQDGGQFSVTKQCVAQIELPPKRRTTLTELRQIIADSQDISSSNLRRNKFKFVTETYRLVNEDEEETILHQVYPTQGVFLKLNVSEPESRIYQQAHTVTESRHSGRAPQFGVQHHQSTAVIGPTSQQTRLRTSSRPSRAGASGSNGRFLPAIRVNPSEVATTTTNGAKIQTDLKRTRALSAGGRMAPGSKKLEHQEGSASRVQTAGRAGQVQRDPLRSGGGRQERRRDHDKLPVIERRPHGSGGSSQEA